MLVRTDSVDDVEKVLARWLRPSTSSDQMSIPADSWREGDAFFIALDLPGVDPETIDVQVDGKVLGVSAERTAPYGSAATCAERRHGRYSREFVLGETIDTENLHAGYEHGVLTLRLPVAERAKPRKISVRTGLTSDAGADDALTPA